MRRNTSLVDAAVPSSPAILFEPLRLGLAAEVAPMSATEPGCRDRVETVGSMTAATAGTPMQYLRAVPLPFVPRLTLIGVSRLGCPIDATLAAGVVHVVPIRPSIFFVTSAGILAQPPYAARPWTMHSQIRADVVTDRGEGRSWSAGIRAPIGAGTPRVTFGGIF